MKHDPVKSPSWYRLENGIECRQVAEHFPFYLGNAIKYIWRSGKKADAVEDLRKAIRNIEYEIERIKLFARKRK
jgi:hypothetical protein